MTRILRSLFAEYRAIFTDAGVLLIFIAGLAIYSGYYPLPYAPEVLKDIPVVPVDQDDSALSRKLMRWTEATEEIRFLAPTRDLADARRRVLLGEAEGIVVIPKGFERTILRGEQAVVSVYADACYFLVYRQVLTGFLRASATLSAGIEIRRLTAQGLGENHAKRAYNPLPLDIRPLFNPAGGYATYIVPAVLILILQQTLLIGIGMVGGTRNEAQGKGLAHPLDKEESRLAVLLGRSAAYFSLYLFYPLFYLFVIFRIYGLPRGPDLATLMLFMVPYVLSIVYLGLALTALCPSRELSIPMIMFTSMPAVFFVGFAWPIEALPLWLRHFSLLLPSTTGVAGFLRINQMGASLHEVRFEWLTLWALCALYFVLAWLAMHRAGPQAASPKPA